MLVSFFLQFGCFFQKWTWGWLFFLICWVSISGFCIFEILDFGFFFVFCIFRDFGFVLFFVFCIFEIWDLYWVFCFVSFFLTDTKYNYKSLNTKSDINTKKNLYFCIFLLQPKIHFVFFLRCPSLFQIALCPFVFFALWTFHQRTTPQVHQHMLHFLCFDDFVTFMVVLKKMNLYLFVFFWVLMCSVLTVCCRHPTR